MAPVTSVQARPETHRIARRRSANKTNTCAPFLFSSLLLRLLYMPRSWMFSSRAFVV